MNERLALSALAVLTLLSLFFAPWATLEREIGARSSVLLLPSRTVDFTGRVNPVEVPGQGIILALSALSLVALVGGAALRKRRRYAVWLIFGVVLIATTVVGLANLNRALNDARTGEIVRTAERTLERGRGRFDEAAVRAAINNAEEVSFSETLTAIRDAGVRVRRLPFDGSGMNLAAFLSVVVGGLALLLGLRISPRLSKALDRAFATVAVPAVSIALALVAAAVVVLALQPTAAGQGVEVEGAFMYTVGRLDTLYYSYQTLFANSLGTLGGFMESLKFATPLIFTGLAVAFGFRAGLFNIGAPGQMVLGAIFAALVGVYMPGPRLVVLPLAVIAAALGGGLWGALPGWLKARFGANEVINTILLNYIAASLLLFVLSGRQIFAAPALRIIQTIAIFAVVGIVISLIPPVRRLFAKAPRLSFAGFGVVLLVFIVIAGVPRPGDAPVNLGLQFKAPGSEPKSYPLSEAARLQQVPALAGVPAGAVGVNAVPINYALPLAMVAALLALAYAPKVNRRLSGWGARAGAAVVTGGVVYGVAALAGLNALETDIPPTQLNTSFILAILSAIFMYVLMWRTKWGYELRAVGLAPKAAEYGGASISKNIILAMAISGAFAGLTACHYVLGGALEDYALRQSLPTNDGFDGIAVALLGGNTPLGVVLSAFLFGVLKNGGSILNITFSDLTRDVVNMILALVVLFIAAKGFLPDRITNPVRRQAEAEQGLDPSESQPLDPPGKQVRSDKAGGQA